MFMVMEEHVTQCNRDTAVFLIVLDNSGGLTLPGCLRNSLHSSLTHFVGALLVVPLPEPDGPWIGGNEDGAAQERSQWGVEDGGEKSLQQQHG